MVLSSFLLHLNPNPHLRPHKITKLPSRKPFSCKNNLINYPTGIKDQTYKLSWKDELQKVAYLYHDSSTAAADDDDREYSDEQFQEMVDRRCVDNLRMLVRSVIKY